MQPGDKKPKISRLNWEKLGFIALALAFWVLIKLSKEGYTYTAAVELEYLNLPNDKVLVSPPQNVLLVELGGTGFSVFRNWLRGNLNWLVDYTDLPVDKQKNVTVWNPTQSANLYREFVPQGLHVIAIGTDSIGFAFNPKAKKKVPVLAQESLNFAPGFGLESPLHLDPDSIWVTGPKDLLDTLKGCIALGLPTTTLAAQVQGNLTVQVPHPALGISTDQVRFTALVAPYTELKLRIAVEVEHLPDGVRISLPDTTVELICMLLLNQVPTISAAEFRVAVDYEELQKLGFPEVVPLHIRTQPDRVKRAWLTRPYQPIVIRNQ